MRLLAWIRFRSTDFSLMMPAPVLDVGDARARPSSRPGQVGGAAHRLQGRAARQLVLERDEVDRLAALGQRGHGVEDAAVRLAVEVVPRQDLGRRVEGGVVDEHRAQHRALGLGVVGERLVLEDARSPGSPPEGPLVYSERALDGAQEQRARDLREAPNFRSRAS